MKRRPNTKTIEKVFAWLEDHGMEVAGPNCDVDTGQGYHGMKNYNADTAIKLAKHVDKGTLIDPDQEE
jgi:effector-binding domain-containing protein